MNIVYEVLLVYGSIGNFRIDCCNCDIKENEKAPNWRRKAITNISYIFNYKDKENDTID